MLLKALAIILATVSASAIGGDYSDAVELNQMCDAQAKLTALFYDIRKTPMEKIEAEYSLDPTQRELAEVARDPANTSRRAAYMRGWALCMDKH